MGYGMWWQLGKRWCWGCLPSAGIRRRFSSVPVWWGLWYYMDGWCQVQVRRSEFIETIMIVIGISRLLVNWYILEINMSQLSMNKTLPQQTLLSFQTTCQPTADTMPQCAPLVDTSTYYPSSCSKKSQLSFRKEKYTNSIWNMFARMSPWSKFVLPTYDGRWMAPLLFYWVNWPAKAYLIKALVTR